MKKIMLSLAFAAAAMGTPHAAEAYNSDLQCREYQQTIYVGGRAQQGYGTACLQPDGSWRSMGNAAMPATIVAQPAVQQVIVREPVYVPVQSYYHPPRSGVSISIGNGYYPHRHGYRPSWHRYPKSMYRHGHGRGHGDHRGGRGHGRGHH